jgi:hypothetical protein
VNTDATLLVPPVAEPTLAVGILNGAFDLADPGSEGYGWTSAGSASVEGGAGVLRAHATVMSGFAQSFSQPESAGSITFTLSGLALAEGLAGPDDAFEVALLDADGLPTIAGTIGLAGSDALLNIQPDGRVHASDKVRINGEPVAPGQVLDFGAPLTVRIDVTEVAAGTTMRLAFDLLAFGATSSTVRIDDVYVLSRQLVNTAPVAVADTVTIDEDAGATVLALLANDSDPEGDPITAAVVDGSGPLHGTLGTGAGGALTYTPNANWFGTDSFRYVVSDGTLSSEPVLVSVIVRPVNDAPTAVVDTVAGAQDSLITGRLTATDLEADPVSFTLVTPPTQGTLQLGAGGAVSYQPRPGFNGLDHFTYRVSDPGGASNEYQGTLDVIRVINGTAGNDTLNDTAEGRAILRAGAGNDTITGGSGDDTIDGGDGSDTLVFSGPLAGPLPTYTLARNGPTMTIADLTAARDGTDTGTNLERLKFADMTVNLTVQAAAASIPLATFERICELYVGFFGRVPAADGLENWINQFKGGKSIDRIADDFYGIGSSPDLRQYTNYWDFANNRELSNPDYVRIVYRNVLGREGLEGGITYWSNQLGTAPGQKTRGELVSTMLDAAHGLKTDADWSWVADLLDDRIAISKSVAVSWGLNYASTAQQAILKGMQIAGAVIESPNPKYPAIPIKTFDDETAVELVGIDPAVIDLIA